MYIYVYIYIYICVCIYVYIYYNVNISDVCYLKGIGNSRQKYYSNTKSMACQNARPLPVFTINIGL